MDEFEVGDGMVTQSRTGHEFYVEVIFTDVYLGAKVDPVSKGKWVPPAKKEDMGG